MGPYHFPNNLDVFVALNILEQNIFSVIEKMFFCTSVKIYEASLLFFENNKTPMVALPTTGVLRLSRI